MSSEGHLLCSQQVQRGCPNLSLPNSFHLERRGKVSKHLRAGGSKEGIHPVIKYLQRETILSQAVKNTPTQIRVSLQRNLLTLLWHIYVLLRLFSCNNSSDTQTRASPQSSAVHEEGKQNDTQQSSLAGLRAAAWPLRWWHEQGESRSKPRFKACRALSI